MISEQRIAEGISEDFDEAERERRKSAEAVNHSSVEQRLTQQQVLTVATLESRVLKANIDLHRERIALLQIRVEDAEAEIATLDALVSAPSSRFKLSRQ